MDDLVFEVTQEEDGGYVAECLTAPIFTEGDDWATLRENVKDVVSGYFFDADHPPRQIRLHLVRDEMVPA